MTDANTRLIAQLEALRGKGIADIFPCGFHDPAENHCAHFVGHVLNLSVGLTCTALQGKSGRGAAVRVHEIFAKCDRVGRWKNRPKAEEPLIVFVSRPGNFGVKRKVLRNVPDKHIGILAGGRIYHFSNSKGVVVRRGPRQFLEEFDAIYAGDQALYFGTLPKRRWWQRLLG